MGLFDIQVKTTNPKKYCVRPNTGIVMPKSSCDVTGLSLSNNYLNFVLNTCYFLISLCLVIVSLLLIFCFRTIVVTNIMCLSDVSLKFIYDAVTMQAQKEVPPDMQCRDKFLLQSVVASPGAAAKDITPEMVLI